MKSSKLPLSLAVLLLLAAAGPARLSAQEELPAPTPTAEQLERKRKLIEKLAFLRLWYFAPADSGRITVCLRPQGGGDPRVIASHVRAGSLRDYRVMRPGKYQALILEGSVVPDQTGKIAIPEKILASVPLDLAPGKFKTLLVNSKGGAYSCEILEDSPPAEPGRVSFRIHDFSASVNEMLRFSAGAKPVPLWSSGNPTPAVKTVPDFSGTGRIELLNTSPQSPPIPVNSYELEGSPGAAFSIVLFIDRYGQKSLSVARDADIDLDEEEAKSLALPSPGGR